MQKIKLYMSDAHKSTDLTSIHSVLAVHGNTFLMKSGHCDPKQGKSSAETVSVKDLEKEVGGWCNESRHPHLLRRGVLVIAPMAKLASKTGQ